MAPEVMPPSAGKCDDTQTHILYKHTQTQTHTQTHTHTSPTTKHHLKVHLTSCLIMQRCQNVLEAIYKMMSH